MELLSIVVPAFNEATNLPVLFERLRSTLESMGIAWEWIVVDDHSSDDTFPVIADIAQRDSRVRAVRLARNSGSHTAILCGLHLAQGDGAVVLAADLQDPPEIIPELVKPWRQGAQVVWAARHLREGERTSTILFSRLYYWVMRHVVGVQEMPARGADLFLIDRKVIDALHRFKEINVSIMALIMWMGFRQTTTTYDKKPRLSGKSGWTWGKKLKLAVDSITSFSFFPIRMMSLVGVLVALLGFAYAVVVVFYRLRGAPVPGWASLMVVVLVIGGIQMMMLGVLGEYLWRTLDEARQRPRYLIERLTPNCALTERTPTASKARGEAE